MAQTVSLTSRTIGDPVRMLDVRCESLHVESRPDVVQHGAGGDVQRSIMPSTLVLTDLDEADLRDLRGIRWSKASWHDSASGERIERSLKGEPQFAERDVRFTF